MSGRLEADLRLKARAERRLTTLPPIATDWYYYIAASKQPRTCDEYLRLLHQYLSYFTSDVKNLDITKLPETAPAIYLQHVATKTDNYGVVVETTSQYRRWIYAFLSTFYGYLDKRGIISPNPMRLIDRPPMTDQIKRDIPSLNEIHQLIDATDNSAIAWIYDKPKDDNPQDIMYHLLLLILITTGIRISAAVSIDVDDIDMKTGQLNIVDKNHKIHNCYLNQTTMQALLAWLPIRDQFLSNATDINALFISKRGQRIAVSTAKKAVSKLTGEVLGRNISPHKFRAAYCTMLYEQTHDIEFVRRAAGHALSATTQLYITPEEDSKKKAAEILQGLGI